MPQYFSPGVYVEEVDSGPRPIEGVSTSVAGVVGITQKGDPSNPPQMVTSFAEFVEHFGGYFTKSQMNDLDKQPFSRNARLWTLPNSVQAFFTNGGQRLFVKPIKVGNDSPKAKAKTTLPNGKIVVEATEEGLKGSAITFSSRLTRRSLDLAADADKDATEISVIDAKLVYKNALLEIDGLELLVTEVNDKTLTLSAGLKSEIKAKSATISMVEMEFEVKDNVENTSTKFVRLRPADEDEKYGEKVTGLVSLTTAETFTEVAEIPTGRFALTGGKSGEYADSDFVGSDSKKSGIFAFEDIEDISTMFVPGVWDQRVVEPLISHCEKMKYRVAVIDAPVGASISQVTAFRDRLDSKHAALYYPWVKGRQPGVGEDLALPPSGHVVGIYADVDARRGVHKAPANEIVKGITDIERVVNKREQDALNPIGINALRFFAGRGNRIWGARTISSDTNFKYVNVRRIFNFIERSIDEGTQWVVFEPNNAELWSRVRQSVNNFLNTQWRAGALEGVKPEDAYFVACDRGTTMTQDDIENGRLIVEVGIAPVYPAEFVIFKVQKYVAANKLA